MNHSYPVFTADAECQDCFKCVRHCPVKAIKIESGHASIIPELCIACGQCVEVCPAKAKKIRNDSGRVHQLLSSSVPVYVSLAPSWVNEFKGLPAQKMIAALKKLGFAGVSETAIGAQAVSDNLAKTLEHLENGIIISSACPVTVDLIRKYMPEFTECISPVLSPAQAHAKMLHEKLGENIKIVFIGPCIAKKNEADRNPDLISISMIFPRLREWFKTEGVNPWTVEVTEEDVFLLETAKEGALYPIEGGMNETIRAHKNCENIHFVSVSGIPALRQLLGGLRPSDVKEPVFIETLACIGGCVHGPATEHGSSGLLERLRIIRNSQIRENLSSKEITNIKTHYEKAPVPVESPSLQDIKQALRMVGKTRPQDELNCGGCGYDTCMNFARALISQKAEPGMCVSYMRNLAQKKSNAILRCIPAATVIVDRNLRLIECNRRFAELLGGDAMQIYEAAPGMPGAILQKLLPFWELFDEVLATKEELSKDMIMLNNRLLSLNIFNIDPGQVIGAMLFDITSTEFRRGQIAARAREVINKNLATVQDIACKLGEHMAETEILLRSIAEGYADPGVKELNHLSVEGTLPDAR
ncbi:MAG: [Fe-Fe] hydrogenase large subunit C-terminal domain-containing protein [Planctomycetia bacterium]|nr:[Fe-Fe] hydrogenase large subunit C-terminal domain-containing protein [Planctomycetia bacterium]